MNLLTAEHLTKVFTQRKLLDNADFSINEGEKIGVIGINWNWQIYASPHYRRP